VQALLRAVLALAMLVAGTVVASASAGATVTQKPDAASSTPVTIALVLGGTGDNFWVGLQCGVESAAKAAGAKVTVQAPLDGTATEQIPIIDEVTARKPDLLIVSATDATAMQVPIEDAAKAGTKVVFVNSAVNNPGFAVSQVLTNDIKGGAAAFEAIKQLNPHGGKVLVIGSIPGVQNTDNRVKGFAAAAKSDPAFDYLGVQYSKNEAVTAAQLVAAALTKDPDIIGIFAVGQIAAEGSATGLREVGKQGQVTLVGYDAGATQIGDLKDNTVQALIAQEPATIGKLAVQQGLNALAGKPVQKLIHTPVTIINRKNVDTTVGKDAEYPSHC
jgi:ribose transport system substrate-binding protein